MFDVSGFQLRPEGPKSGLGALRTPHSALRTQKMSKNIASNQMVPHASGTVFMRERRPR